MKRNVELVANGQSVRMKRRESNALPKPQKANDAVKAAQGSKCVDTAIDRLFGEISPLIADARVRVAVAVNSELTRLNWNIGSCINREILGYGRAGYGKQVVKGLASRLVLAHGGGWDEKTLRHCLRAAETFSEEEIVSASQRQLSWTHIKTLAYIEESCGDSLRI